MSTFDICLLVFAFVLFLVLINSYFSQKTQTASELNIQRNKNENEFVLDLSIFFYKAFSDAYKSGVLKNIFYITENLSDNNSENLSRYVYDQHKRRITKLLILLQIDEYKNAFIKTFQNNGWFVKTKLERDPNRYSVCQKFEVTFSDIPFDEKE